MENILVRAFDPNEERRAVYEVIAEAFPDIDGKPYRPFEQWQMRVFEKTSSFEPEMLYVAVAVVSAVERRHGGAQSGETERRRRESGGWRGCRRGDGRMKAQ